MKLAIHKSKFGFHPRWESYCIENNIVFESVNCYDDRLIDQLAGFDGLLWHYNPNNPKDLIIAQKILFALQHTNFKVFPDFNTAWHFDDKVAQKYLCEAFHLPMIKSYVFFDKKEALHWIENTNFPKVFKLRGGAGSSHVKLAKNKEAAKRFVRKSFGSGFKQYSAWSNLQERWRKYSNGLVPFNEVVKGVIRLFWAPDYSKVGGVEVGYAYFQDFVPNNAFDIRVIVIENKAFALKRWVRENDFRASGSGNFEVDKAVFDERCIRLAFETNKKIRSQSLALDFIFDEQKNPLIVEMSYGFTPEGYDNCPGYWDEALVWHEGKFNPYGWMVEAFKK